MTVRATGERAYFAASNSASGFFSYYDEIFNSARIGHVWAVKGGPGTGKSRFLRDVAEYAERREWESEYVYCSSDPTSLDGVILTSPTGERIALLDATAPHVYEPTCPGAREELVDLGAFWDAEALASCVLEIDAANRAKKEAYRRAYRFLCAFGEVSRNRDSLVAPYVRRQKLCAFATHLMQDVKEGREYLPRPALIRSVGMRGEVGLDTYFAEARRLYILQDCRGTAQYLLAELCRLACEKRLEVRLSHDPIEPDKLDGLFLCASGVAFAVCGTGECAYPHRRINMRRFVDVCAMKPVRAEVNYAERMRRAMKHGAIDSLERVREMHFKLEEIYTSSMDFKAKEAFTEEFCKRLFS